MYCRDRPIIDVLAEAATDGLHLSDYDGTISRDNVYAFTKVLASLMSYNDTPTNFLDSGLREKYPIVNTLDQSSWRLVFRGINTRQNNQRRLGLTWSEPFSEDPKIREAEAKFSRFFSDLLLVPDVTILSTDDDQLRLTSTLVEELGFPRVNNPKKCFGPVATGVVSLVTGTVLAFRLSGRSESSLDTFKILTLHLTGMNDRASFASSLVCLLIETIHQVRL